MDNRANNSCYVTADHQLMYYFLERWNKPDQTERKSVDFTWGVFELHKVKSQQQQNQAVSYIIH